MAGFFPREAGEKAGEGRNLGGGEEKPGRAENLGWKREEKPGEAR